MRQAELLDDGAHCPVGHVTLPRRVGRDVGVRVALREAEEDRVDDGDGERHCDQIEGDGDITLTRVSQYASTNLVSVCQRSRLQSGTLIRM